MRIVVAALAVLLGLVGAAMAQPAYKAPRTPFGHPDLQGVWNTNFLLPLEASPGVPNLVATAAEEPAILKKLASQASSVAVFSIDGEVADQIVSQAAAGLARVRGERRTRQVVEPADGMIPWTRAAGAEVRLVTLMAVTNPDPPLPADHPEQRPTGERCLAGFGQPPVFTTTDLNPRQIVQTRDHVVIRSEYGDDVRIVPFAAQHGPGAWTSTLGDSIARWEGDTLVIETVRMPARDRLRLFPVLLVSDKSVVIEKYRRLGPNELLYQYTVVDPALYAKPWLAEYALSRSDKPMYEHACHEGNYSLANILSGARFRDRERAASAR